MTLDIVPGDLLIDGTDVYPIKIVSSWTMPLRRSYLFRMANATVKTKRAVASGGKVNPASTAADHLTGLKAVPIQPLDSAGAAQAEKVYGLDKPTQLLQTFISDGQTFVHLLLERKL